MDEYRVAVATSDGIVVNQHFGHARAFHIYDIKEGQAEKLEIRRSEPACDTGQHDERAVLENLNLISDCQYLLCAKIGTYARLQAEQNGITPLEVPLAVDEALRKAVTFAEIQKLLERN